MALAVGILRDGGENEKDVSVSPLGEDLALGERRDVRNPTPVGHESAFRQ
jgi:hypothetical protein